MVVSKQFWYIISLLLLIGLPTSFCFRSYINSHMTLLYLNVFLVRDVNGNILKKDFRFYIKGRKQSCNDKYIW